MNGAILQILHGTIPRAFLDSPQPLITTPTCTVHVFYSVLRVRNSRNEMRTEACCHIHSPHPIVQADKSFHTISIHCNSAKGILLKFTRIKSWQFRNVCQLRLRIPNLFVAVSYLSACPPPFPVGELSRSLGRSGCPTLAEFWSRSRAAEVLNPGPIRLQQL